MSLTKSLLTLITFTLLSGCIVIASPSRADFHTQKSLSLDIGSLTKLDVETGSGSLVIRGKEGISEIHVTADIYTSSQYKDNYDFELTDSGKTAFFIAKIHSSSGFWSGNSPHIDVIIDVPQAMILAVNDGSGDIAVSNMLSRVDINDGSGDLSISNIANDIHIDDGSGDLNVNNVSGNVSIIDGSGEMNLENINGNVDIDDGSGNIYLKEVSGSAKIKDGSGDLNIRKVNGTITIDDGSGDIDIEDAGGVKIVEAGSGGLRIKKVKAGFEIDD